MAIRIAHLSDLHFGAQFDIDVWNGVANVVADFKPALIVVSGDLVDHPSASHLIAARCALRGLATAAQAELFVVPGNHDLYEFGNIVGQKPSDLYDRVFGGGDTGKAEAALTTLLSAAPGFTEKYRVQPAVRQSLRNRLRRWFEAEAYIQALPAAVAPPRVVRPANVPVLLAL